MDKIINQLRFELLIMFPSRGREVLKFLKTRSQLGKIHDMSESDVEALFQKDSLSLSDLLSIGIAVPNCKVQHLSIKIVEPYNEIEMGAYVVACSMLLDAIPALTSILYMELEITVPVSMNWNTVRCGEMWSMFGQAVKALLRRCLHIRHITLKYPAGHICLDAQDLDNIARCALQEVRLALFLGAHHRAGQKSFLKNLPRDVLHVIVDKCVPREACTFQVVPINSKLNPPSFYGEDLERIQGWLE